LQEEPRRDVGLDRHGLALHVRDRLDRLVDDHAVAAERLVDRADDDAGRVGVARAALVLADRPHVDLDVAAGKGRHDVRAVILELHVDSDAFLLEVAEVVGDQHRREARPCRRQDADVFVRLCRERDEQGRTGQSDCERPRKNAHDDTLLVRERRLAATIRHFHFGKNTV
jgi:hypothetical protein